LLPVAIGDEKVARADRPEDIHIDTEHTLLCPSRLSVLGILRVFDIYFFNPPRYSVGGQNDTLPLIFN
jgi:hypothetical protein